MDEPLYRKEYSRRLLEIVVDLDNYKRTFLGKIQDNPPGQPGWDGVLKRLDMGG